MELGSAFSQASGQGWAQPADLLLAFGLSSLIGASARSRQLSAGLRTYTRPSRRTFKRRHAERRWLTRPP